MAENNKTLLICASPRHKGTSAMLLRRLKAHTGGEMVSLYKKSEAAQLIEKMAGAERIVISGPCYINAYPAPVMALLEDAAGSGIHWAGKQLYGIINGGMPYVYTHESGLKILENFARAMGARWMGGFVLGGGAMLDGKPLERHLTQRRIVPAFEAFCAHAAAGQSSPDSLYKEAQPPLRAVTARLFTWLLNPMVNRRIRGFGHDPYARSPYAG